MNLIYKFAVEPHHNKQTNTEKNANTKQAANTDTGNNHNTTDAGGGNNHRLNYNMKKPTIHTTTIPTLTNTPGEPTGMLLSCMGWS